MADNESLYAMSMVLWEHVDKCSNYIALPDESKQQRRLVEYR